MGKSELIVKRYKNEKEFQKDARHMLSKGYSVQSVTSEQPRSGCGRILLIGIFAGIFKPKPVLIVTYRYTSEGSSGLKQNYSNIINNSENQNISKW